MQNTALFKSRNVLRKFFEWLRNSSFPFVLCQIFYLTEVKDVDNQKQMQTVDLKQGVSQKFSVWAVRAKLGILKLWSKQVWGSALKVPNGKCLAI